MSEESVISLETDPKKLVLEKSKVWKKVLQGLEKKLKDDKIFQLSDKGRFHNVEVVSTGLASLDLALGIGGIPRGKIIVIAGGESAGKTTLALKCLGKFQQKFPDDPHLIIDFEHALDRKWMKINGVKEENLWIVQPDIAESGLEIVQTIVETGLCPFIIIDSVAAMVPLAEAKGDVGDAHMGLHSRLLSQFFRKVTPVLNKFGTTLFITNQIRDNLSGYGAGTIMPGGHALKHFSSIIMDIKKTKADLIKEGSEIIGVAPEVHISKNKMAPPMKICHIPLLYTSGFHETACLVQAALDKGVLEQKGAGWISYLGETIGQGSNNITKLLEEKIDLREEIYQYTVNDVSPQSTKVKVREDSRSEVPEKV